MASRLSGRETLSLDLARLKGVAARLGVDAAGGVNTREQLRRINRALGERLARGGVGERSTLAQAMVDADTSLPAEVRTPAGPVATAALDRLQDEGCLAFGQRLDGGQVAAVEAHLRSKPVRLSVVPRHWEKQASSVDAAPRDRNFVCYDPLDLWSSPHLLECATQDSLLDLAQAFLGGTPTLCAFNAYWAFPERPADPEIQAFHRDLDDVRSLATFTLLTPVDTPEEGAHFYVETSQDPARLEASLRADGVGTKLDYLMAGPFVGPMSMRLFGRSAHCFEGPAGTSFCVDSFGLRRSIAPRSRPQLVLELKFGTFFNEQVHDLSVGPDAASRRVIRTVLSPLLRIGGLFDQTKRRQARTILARIPATARHHYIFRYLIHAARAEL